MHWIEHDNTTNKLSAADQERAALLDKVKKEALPTVKREEESGAPEFDPVEFTKIKGPGIFEAEFGRKNNDLIFHFWPAGYEKAVREERARPPFRLKFKETLQQVMEAAFEKRRVVVSEDQDVGAIFVRCSGWGSHQYLRENSIKACEKFFTAMGGES
jgi:hypothetical protein